MQSKVVVFERANTKHYGATKVALHENALKLLISQEVLEHFKDLKVGIINSYRIWKVVLSRNFMNTSFNKQTFAVHERNSTKQNYSLDKINYLYFYPIKKFLALN